MGNPLRPFSTKGDATERVLLRAMKSARTAYETGTEERRPILREAYLHTLRAFSAYIGAHIPSRPADVEPVRQDPITSDQQYHALLAACGLE